MLVANERKDKYAQFGNHNFHVLVKHLDTPVKLEQEYQLLINNKTDMIKFLTLGREGELGALENRDKLSFLLSSAYDRFLTKEGAVRSLNRKVGFDFKSKRFNADFEHKASFIKDTKSNMRLEVQTDAVFPAIITDPGKANMLKNSLKYSKLNAKNELSFIYKSNNSILGGLIKHLQVDGLCEEKKSKVNEGFLNLELKLGKDETSAEMRNLRSEFEINQNFDLGSIKVNIKQNQLRKIQLMKGQVLQVDDCTISGKIEKKEGDETQLESLLSHVCNGKVLHSHVLSFKRTSQPITNRLELSSKSDLFFSPKSLKVFHEKFTNKQGSLELSFKNGQQQTTSKLSYSRELGLNSQLVKGKYITSLAFGETAKKECEMNIISRNDYFNSLHCKLVSKELSGIELKYGYNLRVEKTKPGFHVDLFIPARTVKVVYQTGHSEKISNSTLNVQWNLIKDPKKSFTLKVKQEERAPGHSITQAELVDSPNFRLLRLNLDKQRLPTETKFGSSLEYELSGGQKNRFDMNTQFKSELESSFVNMETNLQRPAMNWAVENKFNKHTGSIESASIRLAKLVKFQMQPRRISMSLHSPDDAKYSAKMNEKENGQTYVVESELKQGSTVLSRMVSSFDSANNKLNVRIDASKNGVWYELDSGVFNESLSNLVIRTSRRNSPLALASVALQTRSDQSRHLVLSAKWNPLWNAVKGDLIGEPETKETSVADGFAALAEEFKPIMEYNEKERQAIRDDLKNFGFVLLQFYTNFIPEAFKEKTDALKARMIKMAMPNFEQIKETSKMASGDFLAKYNAIAAKLSELSQKVGKHSEMLAALLPSLPIVDYKKAGGEFGNELTVSRRIWRANNLYQLSVERRERTKGMGERLLEASFSRDLGSLKAIYNKYKPRSVNDYTLVATVFNRRNLVGFDGEHKVLLSKCRYLLAHETHKNRFSVVLNYDNSQYPISVFAYGGEKSFDLGYENVAIDGKAVSLPQRFKFADRGELNIRRNSDGVCLEVNKDLKVCCYQNIFSCTIAATRWFTGKLDGLLGKADNNPGVLSDTNWMLSKACKPSSSILKSPSESAIKTCSQLFDIKSDSFFSDTYQVN